MKDASLHIHITCIQTIFGAGEKKTHSDRLSTARLCVALRCVANGEKEYCIPPDIGNILLASTVVIYEEID